MEQDYNINQNYKPPSKEDIAKHQDFAALLQRFEAETPADAQPEPAPRSPLRVLPWVGALAAAAALAAWFFFVNTETSPAEYRRAEEQYFAERAFINPPFPEVPAAQFVSAKINANAGGVYEHKTGSRVVIPQSAFVDDKGALIEGEVDIKYREFHDYVDFFLSGIPMTYDSAGVQYILESAGMIEVYAEQDGRRVRMAPGKDLDVELVSYVNVDNVNVPPSYNIYKLDETQENWVFTDVDKIQFVEEDDLQDLDPDDPTTPVKQELRKELQRIKNDRKAESARLEATFAAPVKPTKPQRSNSNGQVFDLDFADNPAMAQLYKNSLWQVSPRSAVTAAQIMRNPTDVELNKLNDAEYEIIFTDGRTKQTVIVNPVLTGADYDNALAAFNAKLADYERLRTERQAQIAAARAESEARFAADSLAAHGKFADALAQLQADGNTHGATDLIMRKKIVNRFRATSFGIWNCDRPLPPDIQLLSANFVTDKGQKIDKMTGYMVDKSLNTVNRFLATDEAYMSFNRNSEHLLWVVTPENKIAVFRSEDFKNIPQGERDFTFVLEESDKEVKDETDVREILYF